MPADGAQLADEVQASFDALTPTGRAVLEATVENEQFKIFGGLFCHWLAEALEGKRDARLNCMDWPDLAIGNALIGCNMLLDSSADPTAWNFAKTALTAAVLAAAPRLMTPSLEQARRAEWN